MANKYLARILYSFRCFLAQSGITCRTQRSHKLLVLLSTSWWWLEISWDDNWSLDFRNQVTWRKWPLWAFYPIYIPSLHSSGSTPNSPGYLPTIVSGDNLSLASRKPRRWRKQRPGGWMVLLPLLKKSSVNLQINQSWQSLVEYFRESSRGRSQGSICIEILIIIGKKYGQYQFWG